MDEREESDGVDEGNSKEEKEGRLVGSENQQRQEVEVVKSENATPKDTGQITVASVSDLWLAQNDEELKTGQDEDLRTGQEEEEMMDGRDINDLSSEEWDKIAKRVMEMEREEQEQRSEWEGLDGVVSSQTVVEIDSAGQEKLSDIRDLVRHRAQDILKNRVLLLHCTQSKYFFFLPILEDTTTLTRPTSSGPSQPTHTAITTTGDTGLHGNTKFQLYYLCDCGDIPGFEDIWYPHWHTNDNERTLSPTSDECFSQAELEKLIPLVGEYTMAVLEMLKYGVYVEEVPQSAARRVCLAIEYLQSKRVRSCEDIMAELSLVTASGGIQTMLDRVKPTALLNWISKNDVEICIFRRRPMRHQELYLCRVSEGDVRRVCQVHLFSMLPQSALEEARGFSADPSSSASNYDYRRGVFRSRITSMQRAREFFQLVAQMPSVPVFRISLEWGISPEDEQEIADVIDGLSAAVVHLTVPTGTGAQKGAISGYADGFELLIVAALRNPKVEDFFIFQHQSVAIDAHPQFFERRNYAHSALTLPPETVAVVSRRLKDSRVTLALRALDARQATESVHRAANGLDHLSEMYVQIPGVANLIFKFAGPGGGLPGREIEDADIISDDLRTFFMKRHWSDEVSCSSSKALDTAVSQLGCLTEVWMELSLEQDRAKVRDLIKLNEGLKSLVMEYRSDEDPSNIFEASKALLFKHPRIESFKVVKLQVFQPRENSVFLWKNLREPAKMRVEISCYGGDNIHSMFQRYTPSIERLRVAKLEPDDAVVLEKSMRSKKGPLALKFLSIVDVHLSEPSVHDCLQKLVLRQDIEEIVVEGSLDPPTYLDWHDDREVGDEWNVSYDDDEVDFRYLQERKAAWVEAWADFLCTIRSKVTEVIIADDPENRILKALESRMERSLDMPRLRSLSLLSDTETSLFSDRWLESLLRSKQELSKDRALPEDGSSPATTPLTAAANSVRIDSFKEITAPVPTDDNKASQAIKELKLHRVIISHDEWTRLLGYLDFSQLVKFDVLSISNFSPATLLLLTDVYLESGTNLKKFFVKGGQNTDKSTRALIAEKLQSKTVEPEAQVYINGYFKIRNSSGPPMHVNSTYE